MINKTTTVSLLLMLFISWVAYKGYEIYFFQTLKPVIKHLINFSLLISVALIGLYATNQFYERWLFYVRMLVYSVVIALILVIGVIDIFHSITSSLIRDSIVPFRMFFTSPLPLLVLVLLKVKVKAVPNNKPLDEA